MFDNELRGDGGAIPKKGLTNLMVRTKLERLNDLKLNLEGKLAEVNNAIKLLEANPQLTEIINALERVNV